MEGPSRGRGTRFARGLLVSAATGLVLLGAAELLVRSMPPEALGYRYEDGVFAPPREFVPDRARNALGFHDQEPLAEPARRLVLLGDSYVAALSVPVAETVGVRTEAHLNDEGGGWDVVAIAEPGWGQREELAALERLGPELRPGVVLTLFLSFNDVRNDSPTLQARGESEGPGARRPGKTYVRAADAPFLVCPWSALNRLVSYRLARRAIGDEPSEVPLDYLVYASDETAEWQDAWTQTEELLGATRRAAEALGARYLVASASTPHGVRGAEAGLELLIASYPGMAAQGWDLDRIDRKLAAFCEREGIPLLLLEPVFREETARGRTLHWPFDGHWNAAGNDVAGERLASFVREHAP